MSFDLARDLADVLEVMPNEHPLYQILVQLDEALRRDVQFIDRHPTTFFQVLRNSLLPPHTPESDGHSQADRAIDQKDVAACLARWHDQKQAQTPGFVWVRNHGPLHSGRGLMMKLTLDAPDGTSTVSFDIFAVHLLPDSMEILLISPFAVECRDIRSTSVVQFRQQDGEIQDAVVIPGNILVIALSDGTVRMLSCPTLIEVNRWQLEPFYGGPIQLMADGRTAIERGSTRSYSPVLWMRDLRRLSQDRVYGPPSLTPLEGVNIVKATGDGRYVALVHEDGSLRCVESAERKEIWRTVPTEDSIELLVSDASTHFAVRDCLGCLTIFRAADGEIVWRRQRPEHVAKPGLIGLSSDGRWFAWQEGSEIAVCRTTQESERRHLFSFADTYSPIMSMTFSDYLGCATLMTCHKDRTLRIWDLMTESVNSQHHGHGGIDAAGEMCRVRSIVSSESGTEVVTVATDGSLIHWDPDTGIPRRVLTGEPQFVPLLAISGDGSTIAWTPRSDEIQMVSATTGAVVESYIVSQPTSVAMNFDGNALAYAQTDGRVTWQQRGAASAVKLSGEHDPILHIVGSRYSQWLAGVTHLGKIIIWDIPKNLVCSRLTLGTDSFPQSLHFSPDERRLLISSWKGRQIEYDIRLDRIIQSCDSLQDVPHAATSLTPFRMRRSADGHEFASVFSGEPVAWTPISRAMTSNLDEWTWLAAPRTNGRTWVFAVANQVHFLSLEGNLDQVHPGPPLTFMPLEDSDALTSVSRCEIAEIEEVLRQREHLERQHLQRRFLDGLSTWSTEGMLSTMATLPVRDETRFMPTLDDFIQMNGDQLVAQIKSSNFITDNLRLKMIADAIKTRNQSKDLDSLLNAYKQAATAGLPHLEGMSELGVVLRSLGPNVVPLLIRILLDPGCQSGRGSVAGVLRDIKDPRALEPLQKAAIQFAHEPEFGRMAENAIHCLGGTPPSDDSLADAEIQRRLPNVFKRGLYERGRETSDAVEILKRLGKRVVQPLVERILQTTSESPVAGWAPGLGDAPAQLLFYLAQDPEAEAEVQTAIDDIAEHVCSGPSEPQWTRMYSVLVLQALTTMAESSTINSLRLPSTLNRCVSRFLHSMTYRSSEERDYVTSNRGEHLLLDQAKLELLDRWCRLGTPQEQTYAEFKLRLSRFRPAYGIPRLTEEVRSEFLRSGEGLSDWVPQLIEQAKYELSLEVLGDLETAFAMIERVDLINPLILRKGEVLEKSGKHEEALATYRRHAQLCIDANDLTGQCYSLALHSLLLEEMKDFPAIPNVNKLRTVAGQPFACSDGAARSEGQSVTHDHQIDSSLTTPSQVVNISHPRANPDDAAKFNFLIHETRKLWTKHRAQLIWWQRVRCPAPPLVSNDGMGTLVAKWEQNLSQYTALWKEWEKLPRWRQLLAKPPAFPDIDHD